MNASGYRALWLTCALLFSVIMGVAYGILAFLAGETLAQALISAGAAAGGTATLLILILGFLMPPNA